MSNTNPPCNAPESGTSPLPPFSKGGLRGVPIIPPLLKGGQGGFPTPAVSPLPS